MTATKQLMKAQTTTDRYTLADLEQWARSRAISIRRFAWVFSATRWRTRFRRRCKTRRCARSRSTCNMRGFTFGRMNCGQRCGLSRELDFVGINLTVPHKIAGLAQIDVADESASRCGAVNTIRLHDKKLIGSNTDAEGFSRAVRSEFSIDLRDLRVMILGAGGGTGHAIAWQCALENCERLVLVNRTPAKTSAIVERLRPFFAEPRVLGPVARLEAVPWDETAVRAQLADIDLIVNATPLGMNPSDPAPIPARLLAPHHIVFDCVYRPSKTALLRAADEAGARGANGLSMLLHQGALSFSIWFNREAPIEAMRSAIAL